MGIAIATMHACVTEIRDLTPDALFSCLRELDPISLCLLSMASLELWRRASANELWKLRVESDHAPDKVETTTHNWKSEHKYLTLRDIFLRKYQHYQIYGWPLESPIRQTTCSNGTSSAIRLCACSRGRKVMECTRA